MPTTLDANPYDAAEEINADPNLLAEYAAHLGSASPHDPFTIYGRDYWGDPVLVETVWGPACDCCDRPGFKSTGYGKVALV